MNQSFYDVHTGSTGSNQDNVWTAPFSSMLLDIRWFQYMFCIYLHLSYKPLSIILQSFRYFFIRYFVTWNIILLEKKNLIKTNMDISHHFMGWRSFLFQEGFQSPVCKTISQFLGIPYISWPSASSVSA